MLSSMKILEIYPESFRANIYGTNPFRMIGLIDANIEFDGVIERVTLSYFRSSGTNSGKIRGLWYPIVGIKTKTGNFEEFTDYINKVMTICTRRGIASKGWLAKSLFFYNGHHNHYIDEPLIRGFSNTKYSKSLLNIGKELRNLYENNEFYYMQSLFPDSLNNIVASDEVYEGNHYSQKENFNRFVSCIYNGV